jgi:penicillin-binding protein 1A
MGGKMITGDGGPMAICLAYSKNPGAVYLINQLGVNKTVEFAKKAGIVSKIPPYPSIALGSADLSLIEMIQAYSMFPGRGFNVKPFYINRIEDKNGNVLASFRTESKEVINETEAFIMTKMLQGVVDFGTGRALRGAYGISSEVAGKTGTTNDNADGWFIGFSPQLLSGVWVGCDDPFLRMLYTSGGSQMAMPAWAYYYQQVFNDKTLNIDPSARFVSPAGIQSNSLFDYSEFNKSDSLPPTEGIETDINPKQIIEIPISDGKEKVTTESQKIIPENSNDPVLPKTDRSNKDAQPATQSVDTIGKKKRGLINKIFKRTKD